MSVYRVTGVAMYREHSAGATFEATLPPDVEARALANGAITLIHDEPVTLQPGSWNLADGWRTNHPTQEAHDE